MGAPAPMRGTGAGGKKSELTGARCASVIERRFGRPRRTCPEVCRHAFVCAHASVVNAVFEITPES
jgi:hypothetical protein